MRTYTVKWVNEDGSSLLEEDINVPYGTMPSYDGVTPTKRGDAQYTYTFAGWHIDISIVTGNITYEATYLPEVNKYTVIWKNYDGTILETDEDIPYGDIPEYNKEYPTKPDSANGQYEYKFIGWDANVTIEIENSLFPTEPVKGNVVYTAVYQELIKTYTITFIGFNETVLNTQSVEFGSMPVTPTAPTIEGHDFIGWDKSVVTVTGEATYTAQYEIKTYTVTWKVGNQIKTTICEYGSTPTPPVGFEVGAKVTDGSDVYTIKPWNITTITSDTTFIAKATVLRTVVETVTAYPTKYGARSGFYKAESGFLKGDGSGELQAQSSNSTVMLYGMNFSTLEEKCNNYSVEIMEIKLAMYGKRYTDTWDMTTSFICVTGFNTSGTTTTNYTSLGDESITLVNGSGAEYQWYETTNLPNTKDWIKDNLTSFFNGATSNTFGIRLYARNSRIFNLTFTVTYRYTYEEEI